jgi:hypothetical protein
MFGIFKNVKVQLNLALDRQVYAPGDTVHARITLQTDKEMNIQGGRFTITCQQRYQYKRKHRDSDGHSSVDTTWGTRDAEAFRFDFLQEMALPPGALTFDTSFTLEDGSLPTSKGEIVSATWFAKATLDRKLAADANSEVEFTVLTANPPDMATATAGQYGASNEPGEAQMSFTLRTKEVTGGGVLAGSLRVLPQKEFGVGEVRLEMARVEYVADVTGSGYDHTKETKVAETKLAGKTQLQPGQYLDLPFTLALPQAMAPSFEFEVGSLKYTLKGILARTLRKDTSVEEEIRVYAGRG